MAHGLDFLEFSPRPSTSSLSESQNPFQTLSKCQELAQRLLEVKGEGKGTENGEVGIGFLIGFESASQPIPVFIVIM